MQEFNRFTGFGPVLLPIAPLERTSMVQPAILVPPDTIPTPTTLLLAPNACQVNVMKGLSRRLRIVRLTDQLLDHFLK
jgi:hypothetical protein